MTAPARFRRGLLIGIALIVTLSAFMSYRAIDFRRRYQPRMHEKFGGQENLDIILNSSTIDAYRIDSNIERRNANLSEYPIVGKPVSVSEKVRHRIVQLLSSCESFEWDTNAVTDCNFRPGIRLSFVSGKDTLHILYCFECRIFIVFRGDQSVRGTDFDFIHRQLLSIMQELFPMDDLREY